MPLYTITNRDSESAGHGRVYVGSCTITIKRRMARHYYLGEHATKTSPQMYQDMHETLKRVRSEPTSLLKGATTTEILRTFYVVEASADIAGGKDMKNREQKLLEETQALTLGQTCYNIRRPIAKSMEVLAPEAVEEQRALRKTIYHANKSMCSCGRMIAKGNRAHAKSSVHLKASTAVA